MKNSLLVVFLILISAFPSLTTDMYLPALPALATEMNVTDAAANVTLIVFFVAFGASTLVWGPLSDKYGRKPILLIGSALYFAGSLFSALSGTIGILTAARILQGLGGGSGLAVSGAIVKDVFSGRRQERILAIIQSMTMIGPVAAPSIGSFIIGWGGWRGVFFVQAVIGVVALTMSAIYRETIREKNAFGVLRSLSRLGTLMSHGKFAALIVIFALPNLSILAYVSTSPYIYQEYFGLGYFEYSLFFGACSMGALIGPSLYIVVSRKLSRFSIVNLCFIITLAVGVLAFFAGERSPWLFAPAMFGLSLALSLSRPAGAYITLNYHERDSGAASSLMGSASAFMGSLGATVVTIHPRYVLVIGVLSIVIGVVCIIMWVTVSRGYDVNGEPQARG
jgi:DHA1 family bicyclomycin/chloramphenicol resistance-like MFS transporter